MLVAAASHDVWEIAAHPWVSDQKTFGQLYLQIGLESQRPLRPRPSRLRPYSVAAAYGVSMNR
jgi:hypothetical protein